MILDGTVFIPLERKKCIKCERLLPLEDFQVIQRKTGPKPIAKCRTCRREYDREYWLNTQARMGSRKRDRQRVIHRRNKDHVWAWLLAHPCVICGEADPVVLEFDHIDPSTKSCDVSTLLHTGALSTIDKEIAKCRVLCANCHRRHTALVGGWYADMPR